jgi:hypothetical protein
VHPPQDHRNWNCSFMFHQRQRRTKPKLHSLPSSYLGDFVTGYLRFDLHPSSWSLGHTGRLDRPIFIHSTISRPGARCVAAFRRWLGVSGLVRGGGDGKLLSRIVWRSVGMMDRRGGAADGGDLFVGESGQERRHRLHELEHGGGEDDHDDCEGRQHDDDDARLNHGRDRGRLRASAHQRR